MSTLDIIDIDEYIKKYKIVVVDCWATWCAPCLRMHPIIEELAKEMQGQIVFGELDVEENRSIAMKYQVMSIPTLLVFKNGILVDRIIGVTPKEMLKAKLETYS